MQSLKLFIDERGVLNPVSKRCEPNSAEFMKEAGISEPLWKALVAIHNLYQQKFNVQKEVPLDIEKLRKTLDEDRNLRVLLRTPTFLKTNHEFYKKLLLIHGAELIENGIVNLKKLMDHEKSDPSSIYQLAKGWREIYFYPEAYPDFENQVQMKKNFDILNKFYADIAGF